MLEIGSFSPRNACFPASWKYDFLKIKYHLTYYLKILQVVILVLFKLNQQASDINDFGN